MNLFQLFRRKDKTEQIRLEDETAVMKELGIGEEDYYWFDGECVEDDDSYKTVLNELCRIAKGGFAISNVVSKVNHEEEKVSLSFDFKGKRVVWTPAYENDWFDCDILSDMNQLLEDEKSEKYFYGYSPDQTVHVIFQTDEVVKELRRRAGSEFERL